MIHEQEFRWKALLPIVGLALYCLFNAFSGIVGRRVSVDMVRGSRAGFYEGPEAVEAGIRWLLGFLIWVGIFYVVKKKLETDDD